VSAIRVKKPREESRSLRDFPENPAAALNKRLCYEAMYRVGNLVIRPTITRPVGPP